MQRRRPFVGGNWKMNTDLAGARALAGDVAGGVASLSREGKVDAAVFPPFPYLLAVGEVLREADAGVALGAQDVWHEPNGAYTGEVSVEMLLDCGVTVVLVGHSERRHVVGEDDGLVNRKLLAALKGGLSCILCIGETIEQRREGDTDRVNERQLRTGLDGVTAEQMGRVTIAYEPVWAIGTGETATPQDAQDAHRKVRSVLADLYDADLAERARIQYGGSVKGDNAEGLFAEPDIDGGLIGGASLKAEEFIRIVRAAALP